MYNYNDKIKKQDDAIQERVKETKSFTQNAGSGIMNNKPKLYNTYKTAVTAAKRSPVRTPSYQPKPVTPPAPKPNPTVKPAANSLQKAVRL